MLEQGARSATLCPGCSTEVASHLLLCPRCRRLIHADTLKSLADRAEASEKAGDLTDALVSWRSALELLPAGSKQHEAISRKIGELGPRAGKVTDPMPSASNSASGWGGAGVAGVGAIGLALWK